MKTLFLILLSIHLSFASDSYIDTKTKLIWQDDTASKSIKKDWQGALLFCKNFSLATDKNWRLPSIKELETVLKVPFKNMGDSGYYWSSSQHESSKEFAWMMNFKRAYAYNNYKTYTRYVRCVRE